LHLLNYKKNKVQIPFPDNVKIESCKILKGKKLEFKKYEEMIQIELPKKQKELITVIEIRMDTNAEYLQTIHLN